MRFADLHLERYGRFEDCRLSFRAGSPDFHMIYGPNEAGKSTTLAAVSDLLFGIPLRSSYNFRFDYTLMRVGATLEEDGQRLTCRRRKTPRDLTLVDSVEQPIDEGRLLPLLHGVTRETFSSGFSLDQAGLRRGGEAMVEASSDLGQALFAAGSGLTSIAEVQAALEEEADGIWGRRAAARRTFTMAERQLKASLDAMRDQQLRPKEWSDARALVEEREQTLKDLREKLGLLQAERIVAERLRRISPAMRLRAAMLAALAEMGQVVAFSPPEERRVEDALSDLLRAELNRVAAERRRNDVLERLKPLQVDSILALADRIERLMEERGTASKGGIDLTRLEGERRGMEERAARLRGELALSGDLPSSLAARKLRDIAQRHAAALATLRSRTDDLEDKRARAEPLRAELADAVLMEGLTTLTAAISQAQALGGDFDERCAGERATAERAEADAQAALAALHPWQGDAARLAALPMVDDLEIQAASEMELRAAASLEDLRAEERRLATELEQRDLQRTQLAQTGQAVSAAEVAKARSERDAVWQDIDIYLRHGQPLDRPAAVAETYATAMDNADHVADRRYETAEASARLTALDHDRELLVARRDAARQAIREAEAAQTARWQSWEERLRAQSLPTLAPLPLRGWFAQRQRALDGYRAAIDARLQADWSRDRRQEVMTDLAKALNAPPATDRLSALLTAADRQRMEGEALRQAVQDKLSRLSGLDEDIVRLERQLEHDRRAGQAAAEEWAEEQGRLAIRLDMGTIDGWLELVEELRATQEKISEHSHRIAGITRDRAAFQAAVAALATEVGLSPDGDPAQILDALRARVADARAVAQEISSLTAEAKKHQAEVDGAILDHDLALEGITPLLSRAGVETAVDLRPFLERSKAHREHIARQTEAERQIVTEGDNRPLADLIAEWQACDPDTVAVRSTDLDHEIGALTPALTAAADALGEARKTFDTLNQDSHGAVDAANDAEAARAEMKDQAEVFVLKRAQSLMLRWAMDRYREQRQGPLLRRASDLFRTLTLGRFAELKVDYEPATPRLLGLRADRVTLVPIDGMSEGTADQLFLALRLAAVEQSIAAGVRLPFLADDLFVNFDDERAEAGLRVLAELAASTQVLFFTHHAHLRDIGRRAVSADLLSECVLA
ncbi:AAA family ATPase [Nitrospirillum sp. BR 11164]|uniref:ATP-binding protein n=1 Tax=Nitrospirillum sp. BR 11164 TaxID=3104324 RepID=UPI002AFF84E6|nr:AAA family ATPase [Nitrospirillum sp. BR 11164]MEA1648789.1 AAA family ATPase [Nitrospirillum sp. BR 11164]